jgi:hypothetical protein
MSRLPNREVPVFVVRWLWLVALPQPLKGHDCAGHTFAVTHTALAAHFDFEDAFARCFIGDDGNVSKFEAGGLVRPQAGVGHKQNVIVELLSQPFPMRTCRTFRFLSRAEHDKGRWCIERAAAWPK